MTAKKLAPLAPLPWSRTTVGDRRLRASSRTERFQGNRANGGSGFRGAASEQNSAYQMRVPPTSTSRSEAPVLLHSSASSRVRSSSTLSNFEPVDALRQRLG